jgi:hypothetical protein
MKKYKSYLPLVLLIFLGIIPLFDLFHSGLPITHDGQDHIARIANFYQNLTDGNIIPRWAPNLNWGYGHPILMFLYPFPSYISSFFHFLGFSLVDSFKIVLGITFILSGIFMYLWVKEFLGTEGGLLGAFLYMFAPYRFVDLYVRGDIGEHVAFAFIPLVLYFILKLSKKKSFLYIAGGAISIAGLMLSHNAMVLMFFPIIILYILYLHFFSKTSKNFLVNSLFLLILGFGISSFFWIPAFFEGKYTLRDIVTSGEYKSRFVNFKNLIYGPWSYGITGQFTVQIGILHLILTILALPASVFLYVRKNKLWIFSLGLFLILLISLFLMLPYSNFIWEKIRLLQKFQFPWRFLAISVFATSVIGGLVLSILPKQYKLFALFIFLVGVFVFNKDYWHAKGFLVKPETFYKGVYNSTTDTGESSPIWSVRFMEKRPRAHIEVISGKANIQETFRNSTKHEYIINSLGQARIKENTLYFPGWSVKVDGVPVSLQFQDPNSRGLMTFFIPQGKHVITVIFGETRLRLLADFLSVVSMILILWFLRLGFRRV